MARQRVRQAVRKAAFAIERRQVGEADVVAVGVRNVALELAPLAKAGSLYWLAPTQYVAEQMAPRVCEQYNLALERRDDVASYLMVAMQEFITALVGELDLEHFEAWVAAQNAQSG